MLSLSKHASWQWLESCFDRLSMTLIMLAMLPFLTSEAFSQNYNTDAKSYGTKPESDIPQYVHTLSETGIESLKKIDWIDVGLQYRVRFEERDNDLTRSIDTTDSPILSRTRAYFGVKKILDPFRFTLELQDSRKFHSKFSKTDSEVNELDFIQSYGELRFGDQRPISIRAGRMAFEILDKRLIARNEWRNTTNNFQGFRAIFGQEKNGKGNNDWQLDTFALQPLTRHLYKTDHRNNDQWFYGAVGNWRRWSNVATIQPFYFRLDQNKTATLSKRKIHSVGLRSYGVLGESGFDFDFIAVSQFGENASQKQRAFASVAEIGYSFKQAWKPRLSGNYGYASGDKNPTDSKDQRFEKLFGFSRPWSSNDYFQWENIRAAKTRLELEPSKKLHIDAGYGLYWLTSSSDRWNKANLRDSSGSSGNFIGQEFDARIRYNLKSNLDGTLGYATFKPGEFTRATSRNNSSNFFYLELVWSLF